jgi:sodium transport system permease protein
MRWRNIQLIFWREVSDQLRDRRTLFMVLILPMLLYPTLGIGMLQMTLLFSEQTRHVVLIGENEMPDLSLIKGDKFDSRWFEKPELADKLVVINDGPAPTNLNVEKQAERENFLKYAQEMKQLVVEIDQIETNLLAQQQKLKQDKPLPPVLPPALQVQNLTEAAKPQAPAPVDPADHSTAPPLTSKTVNPAMMDQFNHLTTLRSNLAELFFKSRIQVLIVIPPGFAQGIEDENNRLKKNDSKLESASYPRPIVVRNQLDEKSQIAFIRVKEAIRAWEHALLEERLQSAQLPADFPTPVNATFIDVANSNELAANVWSKLFPMLLIMMSVTGAFYPAVDLGAGEKERGTMETLLISPASRSEIVIGKFLTVMLFSLATALLNLLSMGVTGQHMLSLTASGQLNQLGDMSLPGMSSIFWVVLLAIPLSALFSSLSLAFAIFARSTKEGQYYLTPLLLVTMGLTIFCISPGVELTPFYSVLPVMGPALLLKSLLVPSNAKLEILGYAFPVIVMSIIYSYIALSWAIDQFNREEVLFRESERFEVGLWIKQLFREKEPLPNFWEGAFCFFVIMIMQFMLIKTMSQALVGVASNQQGLVMLKLLIIQQLVIIAFPALLMAILLTTSVRKTLRLYLPSRKYLALGCVLPIALLPISTELLHNLSWFFPQLPERFTAQMKLISEPGIPFPLVILAFAIAPAICEELAFRGFILSGFLSTKRVRLAIILSSIMFGVMHMIPQQVFNASLLGMVLGLLATCSGSLIPGVIYHLINNGMAVVQQKLAELPQYHGWISYFMYFEEMKTEDGVEHAARFTAWSLLLGGLVAGYIILHLVREATKISHTLTQIPDSIEIKN